MPKELIKPFTINEKKLVTPIQVGKDPEQKTYLVLYYLSDGDKSFEFKTGRTETRDFIISIIDNLDIIDSKVIVEDATLEEGLSVLEFMRVVQAKYDDSFDINEYVVGDE